MNIIYERINELCKERKTTYNSVCKELDIRSSVIGNLKSRENSVLGADYALKFADYFGVSVAYIIGVENEKTATESDGQQTEQDLILSNASEDQKELIQEILKLSPERVSALLSLAKTL